MDCVGRCCQQLLQISCDSVCSKPMCALIGQCVHGLMVSQPTPSAKCAGRPAVDQTETKVLGVWHLPTKPFMEATRASRSCARACFGTSGNGHVGLWAQRDTSLCYTQSADHTGTRRYARLGIVCGSALIGPCDNIWGRLLSAIFLPRC